MSTSIRTLTHALRVHLADAGSPIILGHTSQLVAAALGYRSMAVLQASNEPVNLTLSMLCLVDVEQFNERARSLDVTIEPDLFFAALATASREQSGPRLFKTDDDLAEHFIEIAQQEALDDPDVARLMADTNTTGPWEVHLDFAGASSFPLKVGEVFSLNYEGNVQGEMDVDRPYSGHQVNVSVQVLLTGIGARLISGPPKVAVVSAELDDGYFGMDGEDEPRYGRLEAIALELGVPVADLDQLDGAEVTQRTSSSDTPNGHLINIEACESSPVIDQLREKHPSQEIYVLGPYLDQISRFERD